VSKRPVPCIEIEADLVAAAVGEADVATERRVTEHVTACTSCRGEYADYRRIDRELVSMQERPLDPAGAFQSRERLEARLLDLRSRLVAYEVFDSPLGPVLLAHSEQGVVLLEYLHGARAVAASRLARAHGLELVRGAGDAEGFYRELRAYVEGRSRQLSWPLDLRLVRSPFQRAVLEHTARIPYGAVVSYKRLAEDLGQPRAVRAVAQALRWNPVPIAIPCHRVVGTTGLLTGYAGGEVGRKHQLLALEGVPLVPAHHDYAIARGAMYVLTPGDVEYCLPSCPPPERLRSGLPMFFGSRDRAEAVGLRPCTGCRPDLHPLHEVN
jgi:methylated-DNA-[protein]-cysteine S-methyltransferase